MTGPILTFQADSPLHDDIHPQESAANFRGELAAAVCASLILGTAAGAAASTCLVPLYREESPTKPPRLPSLPPIATMAATPFVDTAPLAPGTTLTFYRVHLAGTCRGTFSASQTCATLGC